MTDGEPWLEVAPAQRRSLKEWWTTMSDKTCNERLASACGPALDDVDTSSRRRTPRSAIATDSSHSDYDSDKYLDELAARLGYILTAVLDERLPAIVDKSTQKLLGKVDALFADGGLMEQVSELTFLLDNSSEGGCTERQVSTMSSIKSHFRRRPSDASRSLPDKGRRPSNTSCSSNSSPQGICRPIEPPAASSGSTTVANRRPSAPVLPTFSEQRELSKASYHSEEPLERLGATALERESYSSVADRGSHAPLDRLEESMAAGEMHKSEIKRSSMASVGSIATAPDLPVWDEVDLGDQDTNPKGSSSFSGRSSVRRAKPPSFWRLGSKGPSQPALRRRWTSGLDEPGKETTATLEDDQMKRLLEEQGILCDSPRHHAQNPRRRSTRSSLKRDMFVQDMNSYSNGLVSGPSKIDERKSPTLPNERKSVAVAPAPPDSPPSPLCGKSLNAIAEAKMMPSLVPSAPSSPKAIEPSLPPRLTKSLDVLPSMILAEELVNNSGHGHEKQAGLADSSINEREKSGRVRRSQPNGRLPEQAEPPGVAREGIDGNSPTSVLSPTSPRSQSSVAFQEPMEPALGAAGDLHREEPDAHPTTDDSLTIVDEQVPQQRVRPTESPSSSSSSGASDGEFCLGEATDHRASCRKHISMHSRSSARSALTVPIPDPGRRISDSGCSEDSSQRVLALTPSASFSGRHGAQKLSGVRQLNDLNVISSSLANANAGMGAVRTLSAGGGGSRRDGLGDDEEDLPGDGTARERSPQPFSPDPSLKSPRASNTSGFSSFSFWSMLWPDPEKALWVILVAWGIVPCRIGCDARCYQLFVLGLLLLVMASSTADMFGERDLFFWHVSSLPCAVGALLGFIGLHYGKVSYFLGPHAHPLAMYAEQYGFIREWTRSSLQQCAGVWLLWFLANATRIVGSLDFPGVRQACTPRTDDNHRGLIVFAISSGMFSALSCCLLHVFTMCGIMVDRFCFRQMTVFNFSSSVSDWNILQAVMRRAAGAIDTCFLAMATVALVALLILAVEILTGFSGAGGAVVGLETCGPGMYVCRLIPVMLMMLNAYVIFFKAAACSERCSRVPALINSMTMSGDGPLDEERQYAVQFIINSAAGFYVKEVRLTMYMVMKVTYITFIAGFYILTRSIADAQ